jgi:ribosome-binding factor A
MHDRTVQLADQLKQAAATFINTWSNRRSLITVTDVELSRTLDRATFFVSVFPEDAEGPALGFLKRKRGECREYLKTHVPMRQLPHVEFAIDVGEKHRRRVDELLQ